MKTLVIEQFVQKIKDQQVPREHVAFVCPMCGTVQSIHDLIKAGAGATPQEVEKYIGFSCVGRFTGAQSPREKPDGQACNWTLGGLFHTHTLEVVTADGERHPHFELATPAQAVAHMKASGGQP